MKVLLQTHLWPQHVPEGRTRSGNCPHHGRHGKLSKNNTGSSRCVRLAAGKRSNAGNSLREQLTDLLQSDTEIPRPDDTSRRRSKQKRGGAKTAQTLEDVEIYNIDTGWSEEALKGAGKSGAAAQMASLTDDYFNLDGIDWDNLSDDSDEDDSDQQTEWTDSKYDSAVFGEVNTGAKRGASRSQVSGAASEPLAGLTSGEDAADDLAGWTVSSVPQGYEVKKPAQASAAMRQLQMGSAVQNLLDTMPPEMQKQLRRAEVDSTAEDSVTNPKALAKAAARRRTHRRLRIISGTCGGKRLLSPQGDEVRPMMEMVKAAVFSMIQARLGGMPTLPENSRWLDLFAGTGNVGLEALSRGCAAATFIELDPWVTKACLRPNIATCQLETAASVFTTKAESFMARAARTPDFAGGPFDFISVCPPYMLVSYPELFELLEASSLAKSTSIIVVEYPKRLKHQVPDQLCGLEKVRDRKYGRTFLALYAPAEESDSDKLDVAWQKYA